jgi:hypothetical protein
MIFGKRISEYLAFEKPFLIALVVVGLARLALSLAGVPNTTVRWLPMNAVIWAGAFYFGVTVHTRRFGSYKQLLPLAAFLVAPFHAIAVLGILLTIAGFPNIYAAPEYSPSPDVNQWLHILAHLTVGMVAASLILWGVSSLVMLVTKKLAKQPVLA